MVCARFLYNDQETYTGPAAFSVQTTWNHHRINQKDGEDLSLLVRGYQKGGWGQMKNQIKPMDVDAGFKATVEWSWGGKESTPVSGSLAVSANDDKGNYAEITVTRDSNGEGKTTVTAGHEKEDTDK
jgi:hypothetical protein